MRYLVAGLIGAIFGLGIITSGMANPAKVLNFFDLAGTFDPSLAFVMAGAFDDCGARLRSYLPQNAQAGLHLKLQRPDQSQDRQEAGHRFVHLRHRLGHWRLLPRSLSACAWAGPLV